MAKPRTERKLNYTETIPTNRVIALADYQPHPRNYNRHPASQVERIAASLRKFGQVRSVVVWRNYFLAGHGVRQGAEALGWTELRADVLPDEYPEELALAYVAADNELGRLADPDQAQLAELLSEARAYDAELLTAIGYDENEFQALLREVGGGEAAGAGDAEAQVDRAEELRAKWGVELGQLWRIGEHRLVCGDCTDAEVVARVMGGERANIGITSPPYNNSVGGMKYDYAGRSKRFYRDESMDKKTPDQWLDLCDRVICQFVEHSAGDDSPLLWNVMYNANMRHHYGVSMFAGDHGMTVKETICWNKKTGFSIASRGILSRDWELIFLLSAGGTYFTTQGENEVRFSKWEIGTGGTQVDEAHHASFPVGVPTRALEWFSVAGHICYEPFAGSGTTLVACENLSRRCRAIEISPAYCAVILQRMSDAFPDIEIERVDG